MVKNVDGVAELLSLVNGDLSLADEGAEVGVWVRGGVESTGGFFEVGDELVGFVDLGNGASGGAGDAADHSLGAALVEHVAGIGIIGMDDDAVGNVAAQCGIGMGGRVVHLGIDTANAFLGITGLDGGVGVSGDADTAHREESRWGLGVAGAESAFAGAAAEGLVDFTGLEGNDVHPLCGGIDDIEPFRAVGGVARLSLGGDEGVNGSPVCAAEIGA